MIKIACFKGLTPKSENLIKRLQPTTVDKEPLFSNETTPFSFYNLSFSVSYLLLIERLRRTILKVVRLCNIERLDGLNQFNNPNPIKLPFITTVS